MKEAFPQLKRPTTGELCQKVKEFSLYSNKVTIYLYEKNSPQSKRFLTKLYLLMKLSTNPFPLHNI